MKTLKIFATILLVTINNIGYSQITLPPVTPVKINGSNEIFGTYKPHGDFLKRFPNFLNDGKYYFTSTDIWLNKDKKHWSDMWHIIYFSMKKFDSETFPAAATTVNSQTVNPFKSAVVSFNSDKSIMLDMNSPYFAATSALMITHQEVYGFSKSKQEDYHNLNTDYKSLASKIFNNKGFADVRLADMASSEYATNDLNFKTIIFDFRLIQCLGWKETFASDWFPSHALYKLTVKTAFGDTLKTYGQAVFYDAIFTELGNMKDTYLVLKSTMPAAMENLINQFLNDRETIDKLEKGYGWIEDKMTKEPSYINLLRAKIDYAAIVAKKTELERLCNGAKISYDALNNSVAGNTALIKKTAANSVVSDPQLARQYGQVASAAGGLISSLIIGGMDKSEMKQNQRALKLLSDEIIKINSEENNLVEKIANCPPSQELDNFVNDIKKNDDQLANAFNNAMASKVSASAAVKATYSSATTTYLNDLHSAMQQLKINPTAEGSAITGVSNEATASGVKAKPDACTDQATAAWKGSSEYQTYMRTKLNADSYDCEAKMIELTLQYCSNKLSVQDVESLKKAALNGRQAAKTYRQDNNFKFSQ